MATQFDPIAKDESLNTTEATPRNIADVIAEGLKGIEDALPTYTEGDGIDISAQKEISVDTTFTEASTRANIASGDSFSTILGKIKKFFTDLKAVAFSGAAADVTYGSGSVEDALDGLNIELNVNVQYTNSNITIVEYFRYHRFGKMVVVDIGGMKTSNTSQQVIETSNLPIMRTRPVVIMFSDRPGSAQDHGFLYGEIGYRHFTVSIPNTTMYFYGQFIYFTD